MAVDIRTEFTWQEVAKWKSQDGSPLMPEVTKLFLEATKPRDCQDHLITALASVLILGGLASIIAGAHYLRSGEVFGRWMIYGGDCAILLFGAPLFIKKMLEMKKQSNAEREIREDAYFQNARLKSLIHVKLLEISHQARVHPRDKKALQDSQALVYYTWPISEDRLPEGTRLPYNLYFEQIHEDWELLKQDFPK